MTGLGATGASSAGARTAGPGTKGDGRIGPVLATLLVAGNMIGSGLYLLPVSLAPFGTSSLVGWIVATGGALLLAGVFAVLGRLKPGSDGILGYPKDSLHPAFGFLAWAGYWVSCWGGNVAVGLAAVGYLTALIPGLGGPAPTLIALLAVIWLFVLVNLAGARGVARFGAATLAIGLVPVLAAIAIGLTAFDPTAFQAAWNPSARPLGQTLPQVVVLVFWAFLGLECANAAAAKVRNPARDLPVAALGGVALAGVIYILACVAVQGVIPPDQLARSTAPFADIVTRLAGPIAGAVVAVCGVLKACGTLAGWILVSAETGRAGAAAGYLPRFMTESDPAAVPRRGLIVSGLLMSLAAFATASPALSGQFNTLIGWSVALFMLVYALCAAALLREARVIADPGRRLAAQGLAAAALAFCLWVVWVWAASL